MTDYEDIGVEAIQNEIHREKKNGKRMKTINDLGQLHET